MDLELVIITGLALVALMVVFLRTHASLMIMATCAGFLLSDLWSTTAQDALLSFTSFFDNELGKSAISLGLFLLPAVLIGLHFRKTQSHRTVQQVVPAIFWVVFTAALSVNFLPEALSASLSKDSAIVFYSQEYLNILALVSITVALVEFMGEHAKPKRGRPSKH